jgi:hypothetical protein
MQPLAYALDILQAETKGFIGYLLPTLASLRAQLTGIKPTLKLTVPLINVVLSGLDARFQGYDIRRNLIIARVTLPQFRMRWIEDNEMKNQARNLLYEQLLLNEAQWLAADSDYNRKSSSQAASDDIFFHFLLSCGNTDAATDLDMYLNDTSTEIVSLFEFPEILKLFKKDNTPLPSSAPVERLFSLGGQIPVPKRNQITDVHFERQLLLRANKLFLSSCN